MKVVSATFLRCAMRPDQYPGDGWPEFAFVGRSNVGKSSLLNAILHRKKLAKTSGTPGKTQTINFFDVNSRIYLVDLPGYGYAKVPKTVKQAWRRVMTAYLGNREPLRLVVQLVDARHTPTALDLDMLDLLDQAEVPVLIVATKIDKLKQSQRKHNLDKIRQTLELSGDALIVPFSAVTGEGVRPVWRVIDDMIE